METLCEGNCDSVLNWYQNPNEYDLNSCWILGTTTTSDVGSYFVRRTKGYSIEEMYLYLC